MVQGRTYYFRATIDGELQFGRVRAVSKYAAQAQLMHQGACNVCISYRFLWQKNHQPKLTRAFILQLTKRLVQFLQSDFTLLQGLQMLEAECTPTQKIIIHGLGQKMKNGLAFHEALAYYPQSFSYYYRHITKAGEMSGKLPQLLQQWVDDEHRSAHLQKNVYKALSYPLFLLVTTFAISGFMLVSIIPTFAENYRQFGADLPAFTQMIMNLSAYLADTWHVLIGGLGAGIGFVYFGYRHWSRLRYGIDRALLWVPLLRYRLLARFFSVTVVLVDCGIPFVQALDVLRQVVGNDYFSNRLMRLKAAIVEGETMVQGFKKVGFFLPYTIQMVGVGEASGQIGKNFAQLSQTYQTLGIDATQRLLMWIEPILMLLIGTLVGGIIVAIYLPMFQLGNIF